MSKPSEVPTWATDANYTSGADVGTPTKVDPGAGVKAQGHIPATRGSAPVMNWWKNLVGSWVSWIDALFVSDDGETIVMRRKSLTLIEQALEPGLTLDSETRAIVGFDAAGDPAPIMVPTGIGGDLPLEGEVEYTDASGTPTAKSRTVQIHPMALQPIDGSANPVPTAGSDFSANRVELAQNGTYFVPLHNMIPSGAEITGVRAIYKASASPGTGTLLRLYRSVPDYTPGTASQTSLGDAATTNTTSLQVVEISAIGHAVDRSTGSLSLQVRIPNVAATHQIEGIEITFADPGPRNY